MTADRTNPGSDAPPEQKGKQSFLDEASHLLCDPVTGLFTKDKITQDNVAMGVKAIAKTVPLFMSGGLAYAGLAATQVADSVKVGDTLGEGAADTALGLGKAATLGLTKRYAMGLNASPTLMGVELGIANRFSDAGLTRGNYVDEHGNFSLSKGLEKTAIMAFNPASLGMDAAVFGAADVVWGRLYGTTRGEAFYNPKLTNAIAGGVFGVSNGAGTEIAHQLTSGQFSLGDLAWATAMGGGTGLAGGALGGLQSARNLGIHPRETAADVESARSTPFQKGEVVDASQQRLRDGMFVVERQTKGSMDIQFLFGKVHTTDGARVPAVFRVNDGSDYFQSRMQSEIAMYGFDQKTQARIGSKFDAGSPVTVARKVQYGGSEYDGFIQEMRGGTLSNALSAAGHERNMSAPAAKALMRADEQFRSSFMSASGKRMLAGLWDNHVLNYLVEPQPQNPSKAILGIDADGIAPGRTKLEMQPHPKHRENIFDYSAVNLYGQLAGKKLTPELRENMDLFRKEFATESGRNDLLSVGFTGRQIDGMVGRADWFAKHGTMPYGVETPGYNAVSPILRFVKHLLVPSKPLWQPLIVPPAETSPEAVTGTPRP